MNPVKALENHGQAIWLDFLARGFVAKGDLQALIETDGVKGVTSNPSIFEKAIGSSDEYDGAIGQALKNGDRPAVPVTTDTPFCIYSTSKAVTALVVHMLAERGGRVADDGA